MTANTRLSLASNITPQQAVENVVDVDSLADMYIISELTCDADIYWSSFYIDADFGAEGSKKLRFEAPWDFDSAMGNKNRCIDGTGFYAANIVPDVDGGPEENGAYYTINPWLAVIANEDWYQDIVKQKWTKAYDSGVFERTCQLVTDESSKYQGDFTKNYDKWNNIINNDIFAAELSAPAKECTNQAEAAAFLHDWLEKRVEFLNSQWHTN
ncbi:CotH kinase family protein [Ruminococcus sp.]|uniref:CotH kinase family protein n=1 Tax=Ruminococcus sp. TaxID=41978 RepID=UPI002CE2D9DD|nr:CotH kinase family protein [Ruminococcus sp.]HNZ98947.1 CotH kinase family protein [Ruminococcus sp.]HOH86882.1 CotH kinase family protein [Ruminococcus sp.]